MLSLPDGLCFSIQDSFGVQVGQSQHVKGERALALGWEPKVAVVMKEWTDEGIKAALEKL